MTIHPYTRYSDEQKQTVIADRIASGASPVQLAAKHNIKESTICKWIYHKPKAKKTLSPPVVVSVTPEVGLGSHRVRQLETENSKLKQLIIEALLRR